MAIRFGNTSLQQRVIKKVQDQINQKAGTNKEANSTDVETFKTHMRGREQEAVKDNPNLEKNPPAVEASQGLSAGNEQVPVAQDNRVSQVNPDAVSNEKSERVPYKPPGDQILETLEGMSKGVQQTDSTASTETTRS